MTLLFSISIPDTGVFFAYTLIDNSFSSDITGMAVTLVYNDLTLIIHYVNSDSVILSCVVYLGRKLYRRLQYDC